jgi:hypothetical protein
MKITKIESEFKDNDLQRIIGITLKDVSQKNLNFFAVQKEIFERNNLEKINDFEWRSKQKLTKKLKQDLQNLTSFEKRLEIRKKQRSKYHITQISESSDSKKLTPSRDSYISGNSIHSSEEEEYSAKDYEVSEDSDHSGVSDSGEDSEPEELEKLNRGDADNLELDPWVYQNQGLKHANYISKTLISKIENKQMMMRLMANKDMVMSNLNKRVEQDMARANLQNKKFSEQSDLELFMKQIGIHQIDEISKQFEQVRLIKFLRS